MIITIYMILSSFHATQPSVVQGTLFRTNVCQWVNSRNNHAETLSLSSPLPNNVFKTRNSYSENEYHQIRRCYQLSRPHSSASSFSISISIGTMRTSTMNEWGGYACDRKSIPFPSRITVKTIYLYDVNIQRRSIYILYSCRAELHRQLMSNVRLTGKVTKRRSNV